MTRIHSSRQRLLPRSRRTALARSAAVVLIPATLALSGCSDGPFLPAERHLSPGSPRAAIASQHRPFAISQSWEASGNDFTVPPCIASIPDPARPGEWMQIVISGLLHSSGTATHFGRYTADNYASHCTWDAAVGALDVGGPFRVVAASGDTVWGSYQAYATFGATGSDFAGTMWIQSGTGRFRGASGVSSMYTHDAPDGSGTGWGSGWIAY